MPIHDWSRVAAGIFHDFHADWIFTIKHALNEGVLPPDYYALAEQFAGGLQPDVLALEHRESAPVTGNDSSASTGTNGGVAVATKPPAVHFTSTTELERYSQKRNRITIRHVSDDHVVALLEIMSPGNKASRHAFRSFVDKALEFLHAGIHLVVLDPFPPGPRDPQGVHAAIWAELCDEEYEPPADKALTLASYAASTERIGAVVRHVNVGETLPEMPLFIADENYVQVPLEKTYVAAFAAVPGRWRKVLEQ